MKTFTLEEAAAFIATKYGWHDGAQKTLLKQLLAAAKDGRLIVRHPHTDLSYRPTEGREYYETVSAPDLDRFFEADGAPWRMGHEGEPSAEENAIEQFKVAVERKARNEKWQQRIETLARDYPGRSHSDRSLPQVSKRDR